jgi:uncharacterized protein
MMKYLLVLALVLLVLGLARARRRVGSKPVRPAEEAAKPAAEEMVRCAHCGVHLPRRDALVGSASALYCSEAHRLAGPMPR